MLADRIRMSSHKTKKLIDRTTPSVVVNEPYSTEGNGGRKLVRLNNGVLISALIDKVGQFIRLYQSSNGGETWEFLQYASNNIHTKEDVAIVNKFDFVYLLQLSNNSMANVRIYNPNIPSTSNGIFGTHNLSIGEYEMNKCSLAINKEGTELHACWSSKNSNYPNSFNIRYCKGIINVDGSVTWGSVEQVTSFNLSNDTGNVSPTIFITNNGVAQIIYSYRGGNGIIRHISAPYWNRITNIYHGGSHSQSSPSICVDKDGVIYVTWNRYDGTYYRISVSKSVDNGMTWSEFKDILIVSENTKPTMASNSKGELFIQFHHGSRVYYYKSIDKGEVWKGSTDFYMESPSLLDDNTLDFEEPLGVYMTTSNHNSYPGSVVFRGKWYE